MTETENSGAQDTSLRIEEVEANVQRDLARREVARTNLGRRLSNRHCSSFTRTLGDRNTYIPRSGFSPAAAERHRRLDDE